MLDSESKVKAALERAKEYMLVFDCREQAVSLEEKAILGT